MQIKYNKKAKQQISSIIDYYLEYFGKHATTNLAHEIDEKIKMLRKYPEIGFPEPLLKDYSYHIKQLSSENIIRSFTM